MKEIKIKYYGELIDITQKEEEIIVTNKNTVEELLGELYQKHDKLKEKKFRVAQNLSFVSSTEPIIEGPISLLPAFSGG